MTIQLTTLCTTTNEEVLRETFLGVDLSALGGGENPCSDGATPRPAHGASIAHLASCADAAWKGGLDFVQFSGEFVLPGARVASAMETASRLGPRARGDIAVEVPATAQALREAVARTQQDTSDTPALVSLPITPATDLVALRSDVENAIAAGVRLMPHVCAEDVPNLNLRAICGISPMMRLSAPDAHRAREARFALRTAAEEYDTDLQVLLDMTVIISATRTAARERLFLVQALGGPDFSRSAHVVGTVYDVADTTESWLGMGAADGIIYRPTSIRTDLASLVRGVLPVLFGRAEIS